MSEEHVRLTLRPETAEKLHAALERLLDTNRGEPELEEAYRVLAWRILAAKSVKGPGLTARMVELARQATSVEEYETARDKALGPLLDGLENPENRDP